MNTEHPVGPFASEGANVNGNQTVNGVYMGPVRRPRNADDAFFDAGNVQRALLCKMSVFALERGRDAEEMMDLFEDDQPRYECKFQGCNAMFSSMKRVSATQLLCSLPERRA